MLLKKKIRKSRLCFLKKKKEQGTQDQQTWSSKSTASVSKASRPIHTDPEILKTKNIFKNYGRALCSFIVSELADPYLHPISQELGFAITDFKHYIKERRPAITGIQTLISLALVQTGEDERTISFKIAFKKVSEIFLKYFSVNWIIHGKLQYKLEYLKYRFKILRLLQRPELHMNKEGS
jgi:hypothetical protein